MCGLPRPVIWTSVFSWCLAHSQVFTYGTFTYSAVSRRATHAIFDPRIRHWDNVIHNVGERDPPRCIPPPAFSYHFLYSLPLISLIISCFF